MEKRICKMLKNIRETNLKHVIYIIRSTCVSLFFGCERKKYIFIYGEARYSAASLYKDEGKGEENFKEM